MGLYYELMHTNTSHVTNDFVAVGRSMLFSENLKKVEHMRQPWGDIENSTNDIGNFAKMWSKSMFAKCIIDSRTHSDEWL